MKLNALILLLERFESILLLNPLYLFVVVLAGWDDGPFKLGASQDGVPGVMEVDYIELDLSEEETHLHHPREDGSSVGGRVVNAGFIILPEYPLVLGWQLLSHSFLRRCKFLADLKLH